MAEMYKDYLKHHGILNQKWHKRNGPPYPLDAEDHSSAEKKTLSKSLSGKRHEDMYDRNDSPKKRAKYLKKVDKDMEEHFKKNISKEAAKVTRLGKNGLDQRGMEWNDAYKKGKVTDKDDAQIRKAAKESREWAKKKYGEEAVKDLAESGFFYKPADAIKKSNKYKNGKETSDYLLSGIIGGLSAGVLVTGATMLAVSKLN